jgi:DinB superfamily
MHRRTLEILECLDAELASLRAAVDAIPEGRRNERPAPDRWSVAEVLEHLAVVEQAMLKVCSRQFAKAREAGLPEEIETTSVLDTMPVSHVANRERTIKSPDMLVPKGMSADMAWSELENTRIRFREFVRSCDGLALGRVSFPHPSFGDLNLYQWLLFAAGHHARHAAQVREIATQLP